MCSGTGAGSRIPESIPQCTLPVATLGERHRETGRSTPTSANSHHKETAPLGSLPPSHHVLEKGTGCKRGLQASLNQLNINQCKLSGIAAHSLDISP